MANLPGYRRHRFNPKPFAMCHHVSVPSAPSNWLGLAVKVAAARQDRPGEKAARRARPGRCPVHRMTGAAEADHGGLGPGQHRAMAAGVLRFA
jgi:hypothetical protein